MPITPHFFRWQWFISYAEGIVAIAVTFRLFGPPRLRPMSPPCHRGLMACRLLRCNAGYANMSRHEPGWQRHATLEACAMAIYRA